MSAAAAIFVTVLLDGVPIDASIGARLECGTVVAPLDPFVRAFAERIESSPDGERLVVARGSRTIVLRIGSNVARDGSITAALPIAPYLRAGLPIIPLASVARALGASVRYDARILHIDLVPAAIATFAPVPYVPPAAGSVPTFAPRATPAPRPSFTGIPRPRRTPIAVEEPPPR